MTLEKIMDISVAENENSVIKTLNQFLYHKLPMSTMELKLNSVVEPDLKRPWSQEDSGDAFSGVSSQLNIQAFF